MRQNSVELADRCDKIVDLAITAAVLGRVEKDPIFGDRQVRPFVILQGIFGQEKGIERLSQAFRIKTDELDNSSEQSFFISELETQFNNAFESVDVLRGHL